MIRTFNSQIKSKKIEILYPINFYILSIIIISIFLIEYNFLSPPVWHYMWDFYTSYYPAAQAALTDPMQIYMHMDAGLGFVNIPIVAALLAPLGYLTAPYAAMTFAMFSMAALAFAVPWLSRLARLKSWQQVAFLTAIALDYPIHDSLKYGNLSHFTLLLVIGLYGGLIVQRYFWCGVLLAVAGLIKIPLLTLILYFILRREWQAVRGFVLTLAAIIAASWLWFGSALHILWFQSAILAFMGKSMCAYNAQSIDGFLSRFMLDCVIDSHNGWVLHDVTPGFLALRLAFIAVVGALTMGFLWRAGPPQNAGQACLEFSAVLCLALLIAPIAWIHYYGLLCVALALLLGGRLALPRGRGWRIAMAAGFLLTMAPPLRTLPSAGSIAVFTAKALIMPHYFLGGVLLLGTILLARNFERARP